MRQAIGEAMAAEMAADETVVLIGEDVGTAGGVFKTSEGLLDKFGALRVRDTPISEMAFLGAGVGAAMAGCRPIVEIMFAEFLGVSLDQLVTQAGLVRYLSAGEYTAPMVVRMSTGAGLGFGAQHSQTLENWFTSCPGLSVVAASNPASAYTLLRAAIRDPDPVVFSEPRLRYGDRGEVDLDGPIEPLGRAKILQPGSLATVVAAGQTVESARAALSGTEAEVIDLQTIHPWDRDRVGESVARTHHLITVEANPATSGWGADVVSEVCADQLQTLAAPPLRITCPDVPVPYGAELEKRYLPSEDYIANQVARLTATGERPPAWWEEMDHV